MRVGAVTGKDSERRKQATGYPGLTEAILFR